MFKRIIFLTLILSALFLIHKPSFALYWGIFDDYKINKNKYAATKFINNITIKYAITTENFSNNKINSKNNKEDMLKGQVSAVLQEEQELKTLDNMIIEAFNTWPKDTLALVKAKNRGQEFNDITNILQKKVKLQKVNKNENPDIIFSFVNSYKKIQHICEDENASGCITRNQTPKIVYVFNPYMANINQFYIEKEHVFITLIHEIGHYFALTDQFENLFDSDLEHSTADRFKTETSSVMSSSYQKHLKCDDVDGFINLIDLTLYLDNKTWSARAKNGWNSFCNGETMTDGEPYDNTKYAKAKVLNQPTRYEDGTNCINKFDENGNFIKEVCLESKVFDFYNKNLTYNNHGLVATKDNGEFLSKYEYALNKAKKPYIRILHYLKNDSSKNYAFVSRSIYDFNHWVLTSCKFNGINSYITYNKDNIEYKFYPREGDNHISYYFDLNGKFLKATSFVENVKDTKRSWQIVSKQNSCTLYIEKNNKMEVANLDTIVKEFKYNKEHIEKDINKFCSKGREIQYIPTINYFLKVKKYFHII